MASFEQNKDNRTWSVRFRIVEKDEYKNKRLSGFDTKKAAANAYREFMSSYIPPVTSENQVNATTLTFNQIYTKYKEYYIHEIKESSFLLYTQCIDKHIIPQFQNKIVAKITSRDVAEWKILINNIDKSRDEINVSPLSYKYKTSIFGALVHFFNFAVKFYDLKENVASKVGGFKKDSSKVSKLDFWTLTEFEQFYSESLKDTSNAAIIYRAQFLLLYLTGARKGESAALTWNDIDLKEKTINIDKTATRKNADGVYKITTPKTTNSIRVTDIPDKLVSCLSELKDNFKKLNTNDFLETDFVFGGKRVVAEQSTLNWFTKWTNLSNVKRIRIHDLRHSHVSFLINACGYDLSMLYAVADRIGDTPEQILKTYGHMFPSRKKQLIDDVNTKISTLNF